MFKQTPPVTRNLIIINLLMFAAQYVFEQSYGIDLTDTLGLHFVLAKDFNPLQMITYMFLHGGITHILFNMFALWMFGRIIEQALQPKRFLIYYFVCGIGAAICQEVFQIGEYYFYGLNNFDFANTQMGIMPIDLYLNQWTTIGASGACMGILLAFGMMFPNERIMLLIPPIPLKAKYFVIGYAVIELWASFTSSGNIAHFAHLGGMLFGLILLLYWRRQNLRRQRNQFNGWNNWQPPRPKQSLVEKLKQWLGKQKQNFSKAKERSETAFKDRKADYDFNSRKREKEKRINEILDKIRRSGYDSLTKEEKNEIFNNSRK